MSPHPSLTLAIPGGAGMGAWVGGSMGGWEHGRVGAWEGGRGGSMGSGAWVGAWEGGGGVGGWGWGGSMGCITPCSCHHKGVVDGQLYYIATVVPPIYT